MALPVPEGNTQVALDAIEAHISESFEGFFIEFENIKKRLDTLEASKKMYDAYFATTVKK